VTVDGGLWWQIKVSPTDFTDVTRNVFVNADTGEAVEIRDDRGVREFIAGNASVADPVDGDDPGTDPGNGSDVAYYIVVTDEDGNVIERIPVEEGQDTRIVQSGDRNATNGTAAGN
jgi:hypothetical protein